MNDHRWPSEEEITWWSRRSRTPTPVGVIRPSVTRDLCRVSDELRSRVEWDPFAAAEVRGIDRRYATLELWRLMHNMDVGNLWWIVEDQEEYPG